MEKNIQNAKTGFISDTKYGYIIEELKDTKKKLFNIENFYLKADDDRYYQYLDDYLYYFIDDEEKIEDHIEERKFYTDHIITGVFDNGKEIKCIVPERETLLDEMISIHEIAHLINYLNSRNNGKAIHKEVVPCFNEYEYLKQIHSFYSECYLTKRRNDAIECARIMNEKNKKDCLSYILAYETLLKRKNNYNINKLNKVNTFSKKLDKSLIRKGYTA